MKALGSWLIGASLLFGAAGAFAASTGTLNLSGVVPLVNDIEVTPTGTNHQTLDILNGETAKNVASVDETSNNATGYTVEISSANGGELRHVSDPTKKTTYQLSYDGGTYAQPSTTATAVKTVNSLPGLTTDTSAVLVNVTAYPGAPAGDYTDTLTLTIIANP